MTAKKAVYNILSEFDSGQEFTGHHLKTMVKWATGKELYDATALRHLRSYRDDTGVQVINVNKRKSIYRVV